MDTTIKNTVKWETILDQIVKTVHNIKENYLGKHTFAFFTDSKVNDYEIQISF